LNSVPMPLFRPAATPQVEAFQWDGKPETLERLRPWLGYAFVRVGNDVLLIENRSGRVNVNSGDWIVREDDGFYPMEPALFRAMYVEVNRTPR
jgi:hypothetical protein